MKIAFACDHVGLELKYNLMDHAAEMGHKCVDFGCYSTTRADYPLYGFKAAKAVCSGDCDLGVLICGTGFGISLAANKVKGVRAVVCSEPYTAKLSREHNNANMLAMGARVVGVELAKMILDVWLNASPEGGRHAKRVSMIREIEETGQLNTAEDAD